MNEQIDNTFDEKTLADAFNAHRARLLALATRRLNPVLAARLSPEDVVSAAYEACAKRLAYFAAHPDVPVYFKLRVILLQTLADIDRHHLQAAARDAYKDVAVADAPDSARPDAPNWEQFATDATSPVSRVDRDERHRLLRAALADLAPNDRQILVLRHFDGLGNGDCAEILGIEPKAASIRYARALERLHRKLLDLSCFQTKNRNSQ